MVMGGFKIGSLRRTVEIDVGAAWMDRFLERLRLRAAELGFVETARLWVFEQSGAVAGDLETHTHAKTHKRLTVERDDAAIGARVRLTLEYVDPILGDTGESAYRDAVLEYLSQTVNEMPTVANRSHLAFTAMCGSLLALAAVVLAPHLGLAPTGAATLAAVCCFIHVASAVIALVPIVRNPELITGARDAMTAIVVSFAALALAVAPLIAGN
jgi:hypothetical protein